MPVTPVVIASSSPPILSRLAQKLAGLPEFRVCGEAADLSGTYVVVERTEPKVVILGAELLRHAELDGLLAMFHVMGIRWLRLASDRALSGAAAQAPVLDPDLPDHALTARIARVLSEEPPPPGARAPMAPAARRGQRFRADRIILIGASTGGIDALLQVLSSFPANCPPTAIAQHTGAAFSASLIRLLNRSCAASVVPAQSGLPLVPGTVVVGAGCPGHLRLRPGFPPHTAVEPGETVSGHLPSVDALFRSAVPFARQVSCALLTGMGRDGAQGMLELRRAGAATIAQDEATSVVYGMPRAAWEIGAAEVRLPIQRIGPELLARCAETWTAASAAQPGRRA